MPAAKVIENCNVIKDEFEQRMIAHRKRKDNSLTSQSHTCIVCQSEAYKTALNIIHRSSLDPPSRYVLLLHDIASHILGLGEYRIV